MEQFINSKYIENIDIIRYLGLIVDSCSLTRDGHLRLVLNNRILSLSAIQKMSKLFCYETLTLIHYSHIQSHISYAICLYGTTRKENLNEVLKV